MAKSLKSVSKGHTNVANGEETTVVPLEVQLIEIRDKDGNCVKLPSMDKHFMEPRQFVLYKPISCFENLDDADGSATNAAKEEWMQRMEYIQEDLHWLLKLPHHKFWSQVIYDDSLQQCLQSYLSHAPREVDLSSFTDREILAISQKVHKLIFFVYLRMSTYKESKKNCITPEVFAEWIYENYIFDIPKMMDLCALYGQRNGAILKKMISNVFNTQPSYMEDLETALPHLFQVFDLVKGQLNLNQNSEEMFPAKLGEHVSLGISSVPLCALVDVIYYVVDISNSVNSFTEIYPPSCHVFFRHGSVTRIASFYDTVFPPIENELRVREDGEKEMVMEKVKHEVQFAKTLLVRIFRNLVTACCIQPIVESQCGRSGGGEETAFNHLEELMAVFTEVVAYRHFICDYSKMFPFEADVEVLSEVGLSLDPTRLDYIFSSIHQYLDDQVCNGGLSFTNKLAEESQKNYRHSKAKHDVKDLQGLAATLTNGSLSVKNSAVDDMSSVGAASASVNGVELEVLIVSVLDVLPGFGAGFIEACLNYYNFDSEKVIDALLQDRLPKTLQALDRGLQRISVPEDEKPPSLLSERKNVYDNDEFDVFNRQDIDMERIHQGKKNKTPDTYQGLSDDKSGITDLLKEISLASMYQAEEENDNTKDSDLYEDEYDDTYDSNMVGLVELQTEKELQSIRPFTTPRVLETRKKSPDLRNNRDEDIEEEEEEEEKEESSPAPVGRDEFVPNPAVQRERAEQRRQAMARNRRPHHPRGQFSSSENSQGEGSQGKSQQQQRHHKEKHKSQIANHNRKRGADYKRARGMGALPSR